MDSPSAPRLAQSGEEGALAPAPPADEPPPGLDRMRRFFARPWVRGTWLWLRWFGRGIGRGWRFAKENAGPVLRRFASAAAAGAEVSRRAAAAGRIARDGGKRLTAWAQRRRREGARGRFDDTLREGGEELDEWGGKLQREATDASRVLDSMSRFAGALGGRAAPDPREAFPRAVTAEPVPVGLPTRPAVEPVAAEIVAPHPTAGPKRGTDDQFEEVLARVRKLGRRRKRGPLRALILEVLALKRWATTAELAGWLGMGAKHLRKTHLRPMLTVGQLRLRYPDEPSHPRQAYGLPGDSGSPSAGSG